MENAKKTLVFHFEGGRHASFPQKPVVKKRCLQECAKEWVAITARTLDLILLLLYLINFYSLFFQFGIFPLDNGCNPEYVKCAFGIANVVPCDIGLVYQGSAHACNYPDLLVQELSCDPSALLGGFVCPNAQELQGKEFYRSGAF